MKNFDIEPEERKSTYSIFSEEGNKIPVSQDKYWVVRANQYETKLYESEVKKYVESKGKGISYKYIDAYITTNNELKVIVEYKLHRLEQDASCCDKFLHCFEVLMGKLVTNRSSYFLSDDEIGNLSEYHVTFSGHNTFDSGVE